MKRSISSLIATILIIGFTVVLAALVMQWGSQLFEGEPTIEEWKCINFSTKPYLNCKVGYNGTKCEILEKEVCSIEGLNCKEESFNLMLATEPTFEANLSNVKSISINSECNGRLIIEGSKQIRMEIDDTNCKEFIESTVSIKKVPSSCERYRMIQ